ncbi:fibronectin type III domain-containing protein [Marinitoga aeolica]|uniref:Fibronectin type III domain-containing protein n=1 Tax=Marinitoga aeolica TaxID=2809031 RepID=A0ABY8PTK6_9BACT|nr:fibronectin type III domain-containing protein [Marinitoga aeolica]WGS65975.1 fibronectin type III domain-containing protein [Marinitoga aeolica]
MKKSLIIYFLFLITISFSNIIWEINPTNFKIVEYNKFMTLSWDINEKVNYYSLYFGESEKNLKLVYNGEKSKYIIKELKPNKNYYWRIKAYTEKGIIESEIFRFYLQLKKPEIKNVYPNFEHDLDSSNIQFKWNLNYPVNYTTTFILYKNNEKIIEKRLLGNKYVMNLVPGINYKWYIILDDEFKNKYTFGPYIFSTKPFDFLMSLKNSIYEIKTYDKYLEKRPIYNLNDNIESFYEYKNFIILKMKDRIEIVHKSGKKTSEIDVENIKDYYIEKKNDELLLYIVNEKSLKVFDITNPYYPFLKKEIIGNFISVSSNDFSIILLSKNNLILMDKKYKIYFQKEIKQLKKIIYNNNKMFIVALSDKLIRYDYKNGMIYYKKELRLSKIISYDIYENKIAFLTINNEIYVYNMDFELLDYIYLKEKIKKIKLYGNLIYYYSDDLNFIEMNNSGRK